jgi:hypothetical protein
MNWKRGLSLLLLCILAGWLVGWVAELVARGLGY